MKYIKKYIRKTLNYTSATKLLHISLDIENHCITF